MPCVAAKSVNRNASHELASWSVSWRISRRPALCLRLLKVSVEERVLDAYRGTCQL